jgi:hypothetical protein
VCLNGVIALLYWKDMKSIAKEFSVWWSDGEE